MLARSPCNLIPADTGPSTLTLTLSPKLIALSFAPTPTHIPQRFFLLPVTVISSPSFSIRNPFFSRVIAAYEAASAWTGRKQSNERDNVPLKVTPRRIILANGFILNKGVITALILLILVYFCSRKGDRDQKAKSLLRIEKAEGKSKKAHAKYHHY
ncbi:hypothetical protein J2X14_002344 [Pantoea alhagi]|uniref:hypothetical protein n=1 Tax=Mixta sp. BE291 TaxID=3158787 RepID=UPI0028659253|nr:hypothetical protein [Pantoea alhagi]